MDRWTSATDPANQYKTVAKSIRLGPTYSTSNHRYPNLNKHQSLSALEPLNYHPVDYFRRTMKIISRAVILAAVAAPMAAAFAPSLRVNAVVRARSSSSINAFQTLVFLKLLVPHHSLIVCHC
jgi:hypothetical protein